MKGLIRFIKWLVFTNLYISIAAACFQLAAAVLMGALHDWNWMLSAHTLFSTSLVYQFSRWNYHKQNRKSEVKRDELYNWLDSQSRETVVSIIVGALGTFVTLFFLQWNTILILAALGVISMLYPLRWPNGGSLRGIPVLKIFLIAFVWAGISVWVPLAEQHIPLAEGNELFAFHAMFIFFITLPFDIADVEVDKVVHVKTIPHLIGIAASKYAVFLTGLLALPLYAYFVLPESCGMSSVSFVLFLILSFALSIYTQKLYPGFDKWKIMAVYDGSMIVYFLITLASYG